MNAQYDIWILVEGEWVLYHEFDDFYKPKNMYNYTDAISETRDCSNNDSGYVFAIGVNENEPVGEVIFLNGDLFLMQKDSYVINSN